MIDGLMKRLGTALAAVLVLAGAVGLAQPVPVSGLDPDAGPSYEAWVGSSATVVATFANDGTEVGYGPYLDVVLPAEDAMELSGASYDGVQSLTLSEPLTAGDPHPHRKNPDGTKPYILTEDDVPAGEVLYTMLLPYGSIAPGTNPHRILLNMGVSRSAPLETLIPVRTYAGFHSDDELFGGNGYRSAAQGQTVTPYLARLRKTVDAAESETAVGPSFTHNYTVGVEIAPGEQLRGLEIIDELPNNIVITEIPSAPGWDIVLRDSTGGNGNCAATDLLPAGPCNDWQLVATFNGDASGSPEFTFGFYVPFEDANGRPVAQGTTPDEVVNTVRANDITWVNHASGSGTESLSSELQHLDITRNAHGSNGDGNNESGIMMIQKYARNETLGGTRAQRITGGAGNTIVYELEFQISDHSAYDNIVITDVLGDGLDYVGNATLRVSQHGVPPTTSSIDAASESDGTGEQAGSTIVTFNVPGPLLGACVDGNGALPADEACFSPGTTGTLTFEARIQDLYRVQDPPEVVQGDTVHNDVTIEGRVLNTAQGNRETEFHDSDTSRATVEIPLTTIEKAIVAVNGEPYDEDNRITLGDEVTFSLRANLPASDVRAFYLADELPWPVFAATEFNAVEIELDASQFIPPSTYPGPGQAAFVNTTTFPPGTCDSPNVQTNVESSANRIVFDFGDYQCAGSAPTVIEIYLTATVRDIVLDDGFIINNRMVASENNDAVTTANELLTYTRPVLDITKRIVGVGGASSSGMGSTLNYRDEVLSGDLDGFDVTDLGGIDALDIVTFAIFIENSGGGIGHNITLTDNLPDPFTPANPDNVRAWLGNEVPLTIEGDLFDGTGATFIHEGDPLELAGSTADGSNIIVITYELTIPEDIEGWSVLTNTAEVTNVQARDHEDSPNLADPGHDGPLRDSATVRINTGMPTKSLVTTSEDHTADSNVAIGEIVRYRLTARVPEGVSSNFMLFDDIPEGMQFLNDGTARAALVSNGGLVSSTLDGPALHLTGDEDTSVDGLVEFVLPADAISTSPSVQNHEFGSGTDVYFKFGDLTNSDSDENHELVIVEFNALVLNVSPPNAAGTTLSNTFQVRTGDNTDRTGNSDPVAVTLVEPDITLAKTNNAVSGEIDAGDEFTYTITITNENSTNSSTAFEVEITDELPPHLVFVSATDGIEPDGSGVLTFSIAELEPGESDTFDITVHVADDAPTNSEITNTAVASWTSLPGDNGTTGNLTGSDTPGDSGAEDGERITSVTAASRFTTAAIAPGKEIVTTSESLTSTPNVAIGEIIRYRVTATIPEGDTSDLQLVDTLPAGLQFIDPEQVTVSITGEDLVLGEGLPPADGSTVALPGNRISEGTTANTVTFAIGDVRNPPIVSGDGVVTIEYNALVLNIDENRHGTDLLNSFQAHDSRGPSGPVARTTVTVEEPLLTVAKISDAPEVLDIGTEFTYTVTITNTRGTAFDVHLTDELPAGLELLSATIEDPEEGYTASVDTVDGKLTVEADTGTALATDDSITVTYVVEVTEDVTADDLLINTAVAGASSLPGAHGSESNDTHSTTPGEPGSENGERLYEENGSSDVTIGSPELTVSKTLTGEPINHADGTYTVRYGITVRNTGNIDLVDVQITDDLVAAFVNGAQLVSAVAIDHDAANTAFNGTSDTALFSDDGIALGHAENSSATVTVEAVVRLDSVEQLAPAEHVNTVTATGRTTGGLEPEPASDTVPVTFTEEPSIAVSKVVFGEITNHEDGSFEVTYAITVENTGDVDLSSVSLHDPLDVYGTGAVVHSVTTELQSSTGSLVLNSDYDGVADEEILDPASTLAVGAVETVHVTVTVTPANSEADYTNTVTASGDSPVGEPVDDDDSVTHTFTVSPAMAIATCLPAGGIVPHAELPGQYRLTFSVLVRNFGNVQLDNLTATLDLEEIFGWADWFEFVEVDGDYAATTFNGTADTELFAAETTLYSDAQVLANDARSDRAEFTVTVDIIPGATRYYGISATAAGESPIVPIEADDGWIFANSADDCGLFDEGAEPHNPEDPEPTPVEFPDGPLIGVAKRFNGLEAVEDQPGVFDITFTFVVRNYGTVPLGGVQLTDDFQAAFDSGGGATWEITDIQADAPLEAVDDYAQAAADGELLTWESYLDTAAHAAAGLGSDRGTVTVTLRVTPEDPSGDFFNNASASAYSNSSETPVEDDSTDGSDPDRGGSEDPSHDGDGDPTNNTSPTPFTFEDPAIGLAKAAEVTPVGDGRYDVLFTFTVRNYGNAAIRNLQLTDSLTDAFGADTYVVQSLWSPTLTVNALAPASGSPAAYDGDANLNLLAGTDTLPVGGEATVELLVRVKPAEARTYENVATTTGTTPGGQPVEDDSTDGFDPDPDGDDDPSNNDDPTPVPFEENPLIGVAKAAEVTANEDGSFNIDLTFTIGNYGDVPLKNVTLSDPLTGIYSITDLTPARVSVTSSQLTVNPDYDGQTNAEILAGTDTLAVGAFREVRVRLSNVRPVSGTSTTNTAVARGESPTGTPVEDDSTDGFDPDPDGNDDPTDNDEPTPIELERITQIALAKSGSLSFDADGLLNLEFTFTVRNTGNITLHGVQVRDDLEEYWANTNLTSAMIDVTSSDFTANPAFDGQADDQLLTGSDSLAPGRTGTVTVTLSGFTANDGVTELYNTALATARDPDGNPTEDPSNDGDDPIPGEDVPTRTDLRENPLLGVAKNADRVVVEEDGSFTVAFTLTLTNYGNTDLVNMSLTDDLQQFVDGGMTSATVTSTDLPVNGSFNGTTDQELLGPGANLAIGESAQLTLVLSGITEAGTYENQAVAEGESPGGTPTPPDRSTDGTDPDPDGDGDPTNNDDPTPVVLENDPILGVAKRARVTQAEAGSWDITFTILVRNMGNTHLADIQVTDDLSDFADGGTNFPGGATLSVSSADFPVNGAYDGLTDTDLLGSGASLAAGAEGTVTVTLSGFASEERTQFENSATGTGTPPGGEPVRDDSQNGNDPDPDGDGDPTNNDDPTPVELVTRPAIGIAKKADITKHEDGTFDVVFTMTVGNYGNTVLENVQVRDSLLEFYGPTNLSADHISVESGDFTPNPAYDGLNDLNLLTGTDSLGLDETGTLTLSLTGISIYEQVDTYNTAIASGTDPGGKPARPDESQDGDDPDPDGDGNPGNNNDPTPVHLVVNPLIGLAKAAETTDLGDGSYDVVFTLTLVNYGDVPLSDLSISDPLTAFYENTSLSAADISVASADLSVNAAYDGATVTELLSGSNTLASGAEATLTITLSGITPDAGVTRLDNSAYASGRAPDGSRVSDTSQDGTNPDPDGDGNPGNNSDPTPVFFDGNVALLLQKDANPGPYGIGDRVSYRLTLTNPNDTATSVTLTDVIPQRTQYIEATAAFDPAGTAPSEGTEPRQDEDGVLTWRAIVLPAGESVTVTYDLRILAGATSPLVNTATLSAGTDVTAQASASVELDQGVFDLDRSTLIGRVYIDVNRNATYDEGIDIPLENARVVLANGWQTLTDEQGNYAFRELDSGTWTVMVDQLTTPYDPQAHPEQLRDPRQHRVDVRGLTVSDFPFEDLAGLASSRRETFVTFGDIELHKYQVPLGSTVRTVIEVTAGGEWPPVLITDPVPGSDAREFIVELTGDEPVFLTYDLPAGTQLTDPVIEWSNR